MIHTSPLRLGALALATLALAACTATANNQTAAEAYIRANVSDLSPTPAVLGGTFYVTDIEWQDDDTAIVSYEDGHIALKGRTDIVVSGDAVTTSAFVIVDAGTGDASSDPLSSDGSASSVAEKPRAKEGEMCGGIAGILCDFGLMCQYEAAHPDASGTCVK